MPKDVVISKDKKPPLNTMKIKPPPKTDRSKDASKDPKKVEIYRSKKSPLNNMKIKGQEKGILQIGQKPESTGRIDTGKLNVGIPVDSVKNGILTTKQYGDIEDISGEAIYNNLKSNASPIYFPWSSMFASKMFSMVFILKNNSNDCSLPKKDMIAFNRPPKNTKNNIYNANRTIIENKEAIAQSIIRCWKRKKVVVIPIHISQAGSGRDSHHSNLLLFNTWRMEAEHFEPHGEEYKGGFNKKGERKKIQGINLTTGIKDVNKEITKQIDNMRIEIDNYTQPEKMRMLGLRNKGFTYLPPDKTCPTDFQGYKGFQSRDRSSGGKKNFEGVVITEQRGYCVMYSLFALDMRLKTLRSPAKDIVRVLLGLFKKDYDVDTKSLEKEARKRLLTDKGKNYVTLTEAERKEFNDEFRAIKVKESTLRRSFLELMRGMSRFAWEEQLKMVDKGLITKQELIKALGTDMNNYKDYKEAVDKYLFDDWVKFAT